MTAFDKFILEWMNKNEIRRWRQRLMPKVKMEDVGIDVPVIKLRINSKDYYFVVDTGAESSCIINELIPANAGIHSYGMIHGVGGAVSSAMYSIKAFNLLGVNLNHVIKDDSIQLISERCKVKFGGLLGNDLLSKFSSVTFDFKQRIIEFKP